MALRVRLLKRLGQHPEGSLVHYRDSEATWLIQRGCAVQAEEPTEAPTPPVEGEATGHTLAALRAKAESMGLKTYGTKAQLVERITRATLVKP